MKHDASVKVLGTYHNWTRAKLYIVYFVTFTKNRKSYLFWFGFLCAAIHLAAIIKSFRNEKYFMLFPLNNFVFPKVIAINFHETRHCICNIHNQREKDKIIRFYWNYVSLDRNIKGYVQSSNHSTIWLWRLWVWRHTLTVQLLKLKLNDKGLFGKGLTRKVRNSKLTRNSKI